MKLAFLFPGQASQYVGMGKDLWERFPEVKAHYERTNQILGADIARLSFEGPQDQLTQTENTQPAIFSLSVALWQLLDGAGLKPVAAAGHSLGEYAALVAAGVFPYPDALSLVQLRGRLMQEAGQRRPGTMAAIIGLSAEEVERICGQASPAGLVQLANHNSPVQVVISGEVDGVARAMELAKEAGAKRALPLSVSGAFHSPLMEYARDKLSEALQEMQPNAPRVPVVANVTAREVASAEQVPDLLVRQLISPVRWSESMERMSQMGIELFVEVGPGKVLQGLAKRILPQAQTAGVTDVESLEALLSR